MAQKTGDCYIDVWRDAGFRGETKRIYGPAEFSTLDFGQGNWGDDIGSLRVGPNAFVMAYQRRDFQDKLITFGPNDEVADLGEFKFDDEIESLQVIDSLKIFNHLAYNSDLTPEAPEADSTEGANPDSDLNKGNRRKSKKR
jgi:hypothetical protein